jgi:hypothetical protein
MGHAAQAAFFSGEEQPGYFVDKYTRLICVGHAMVPDLRRLSGFDFVSFSLHLDDASRMRTVACGIQRRERKCESECKDDVAHFVLILTDPDQESYDKPARN